MANIQIQNLEIELSGLRAQQRHLTDEAQGLLHQIRVKEAELKQAEEFEKHRVQRIGNHSRRYPENQGRDHIGPLKGEIAALENRRELTLKRVDSLREEMSHLATLLDRCRRYAETAQSANTPAMSAEGN